MSSYNEDERVVSMKFDDSDFQRGAKRSIKTLESLEDAISMEKVKKDSSRTLEAIAESVEKIASKSYSIVDRYVDKIRDKVSNLMYDITIESTLGQINAGWQKFADKSTAVGTLVSQGNALRDVNEQLEKLNWFTDETSYNFVDMVSNIGKFTAVGQSLEDSEKAMMGIANWAALSGQNAATASRAMYQLSQAMGAGVMRRQDYMSIQNANMDTVEFKQHCLDAAVALGTLRKEANGTYTSIAAGGKAVNFNIDQFANNLTEGAWFTKDVMMEVFSIYGSAVDKIREITEDEDLGIATAADALKYIERQNEDTVKAFRNVTKLTEEEAKKEIVELNKVKDREEKIRLVMEKYNLTLENSSDLVDQLSDYVDEFGIKAFKAAQEARTFADAVGSLKDAVSTKFMTIYEYIFGDYYKAKTLWTDFANWLYDIFAAKLDTLSEIMRQWSEGEGEFGGRSALMRGVYGFTEAISNVVNTFRSLEDRINPIEDRVSRLKRLAEGVEKAGMRIYMFVYQLRQTEFFSNVYYTLHNIKETLISLVSTAIDAIKSVFPNLNTLPKILAAISKRFLNLSHVIQVSAESLGGLKKSFALILRLAKLLVTIIGKVFDKWILPGLEFVLDAIDNVLEVIVRMGEYLADLLNPILDVSEGFGEIKMNVEGIDEKLKKLGEVAKWFGQTIAKYLKPAFEFIKDVIVELWGSLKELFTFNPKTGGYKIADYFKYFGTVIKDSLGDMEAFKNIFEKFKNNPGLAGLLQLFIDLITECAERVDTLFESFDKIDSENMPLIFKIPLMILSAARRIWSALKFVYDSVLKPLLTDIVQIIDGTFGEIIDALKVGDLERVIDIVNGLFTTGVLGKLIGMFKAIQVFFGKRGLLGLINSARKALDGLAMSFKTEAMDNFSKALLRMVAALAGIVGLAVAITLWFPEDKLPQLKEMMVALVVEVIALGGAMWLLGKTMEATIGSMFKTGVGILALSLAIMAIVKSIKLLSETMQEAGQTIVLFVETLVFMIPTVFGAIMGKKLQASIAKLGIFLLGLAAIIPMFVFALNNLDISPGYGQKLVVLGTCLLLAAGVMRIAGNIKDNGGFGVRNALAFGALVAVVVYILIPMLDDMSKANLDYAKLTASALLVGGFALMLSASIGIMAASTKKFTNALGVIALTASAIYLVTNVLMPALISMAKEGYGMETYGPILATISTIMLSAAAMFFVLGRSVKSIIDSAHDAKLRSGVGVLLVLGGVVIALMSTLTICMRVLDHMKGGSIAATEIALVTTIALFFGEIVMLVNFISGTIEDNKDMDMKSITKMLNAISVLLLGAILSFAMAVMVFSTNVSGSLAAAGVLVGGVLLMVGAMMLSFGILLEKISKIKNINITQATAFMSSFMKGTSALMLIIMGGVIILGEISNELKDGWAFTGMIVSVIAILGTVFYALYKFVRSINGLKDNMKHIQQVRTILVSGMGMLAIAVGGVIAMTAMLSNLDETSKWTSIIAAAVGMGEALGTMYVALKILKNIADLDLSTGKLFGIVLAFTILLGEVIGLTYAFEELTRNVSPGHLIEMVVMLGAAVAGLWGLTKVMEKMSGIGFIAGLKVAGIVAALGGALWVLGAGIEKIGGSIAKLINGGFTDEQGIASPSKTWKTYGKYLVDGLDIGVKKESKKVIPRASAGLAAMVNGVFCASMGIHSPSQVMFQNGVYIVAGLVEGMGSPYETKRLRSKSTSTGNAIGDAVAEGTKNALDDTLSEIEKGIFGDKTPDQWFKDMFSSVTSGAEESVTKLSGNLANKLWKGLTVPEEEMQIHAMIDGKDMFLSQEEWQKINEEYYKQGKMGSIKYIETVKKTSKSKIEQVGESLGFSFGDAFSSDGVIGKLIEKLRNKFMYKEDGSETVLGSIVGTMTDGDAEKAFEKVGTTIGSAVRTACGDKTVTGLIKDAGLLLGSSFVEGIITAIGAFIEGVGDYLAQIWPGIKALLPWTDGSLFEANQEETQSEYLAQQLAYKNRRIRIIEVGDKTDVHVDLNGLTDEEIGNVGLYKQFKVTYSDWKGMFESYDKWYKSAYKEWSKDPESLQETMDALNALGQLKDVLTDDEGLMKGDLVFKTRGGAQTISNNDLATVKNMLDYLIEHYNESGGRGMMANGLTGHIPAESMNEQVRLPMAQILVNLLKSGGLGIDPMTKDVQIDIDKFFEMMQDAENVPDEVLGIVKDYSVSSAINPGTAKAIMLEAYQEGVGKVNKEAADRLFNKAYPQIQAFQDAEEVNNQLIADLKEFNEKTSTEEHQHELNRWKSLTPYFAGILNMGEAIDEWERQKIFQNYNDQLAELNKKYADMNIVFNGIADGSIAVNAAIVGFGPTATTDPTDTRPYSTPNFTYSPANPLNTVIVGGNKDAVTNQSLAEMAGSLFGPYLAAGMAGKDVNITVTSDNTELFKVIVNEDYKYKLKHGGKSAFGT